MAETKALATKDIHALLDRKDVATEIRKALPKHLTPERLIRMAATAIQKSPGLKKCTPLSLLACVVECGQLGLEPDGILGDVYLVPFKEQATIIVGYKGFMKLAYQTGDIYKITYHVVRKGESFGFTYGTNPSVEHTPKDHGEEKDDATWVYAYAVAHFRDGHTDFEVLERADVFKRRSRSRAYTSKKLDSPWFTDPEAMWKKSAVRALAARLPKSTTDNRLARAVAIDEMSDAGLLTATATGFEISEDALTINEGAAVADAPIQEAREVVEEKKSRGGKKPEPKGDVIDVKAEKPKDDPIVKMSDVYNRGTMNGWKISDINAWIKKEFGISDPLKETRQSWLPKIMKAMESGTD
jgi:recombination protein RecT